MDPDEINKIFKSHGIERDPVRDGFFMPREAIMQLIGSGEEINRLKETIDSRNLAIENLKRVVANQKNTISMMADEGEQLLNQRDEADQRAAMMEARNLKLLKAISDMSIMLECAVHDTKRICAHKPSLLEKLKGPMNVWTDYSEMAKRILSGKE